MLLFLFLLKEKALGLIFRGVVLLFGFAKRHSLFSKDDASCGRPKFRILSEHFKRKDPSPDVGLVLVGLWLFGAILRRTSYPGRWRVSTAMAYIGPFTPLRDER